MQDCPRCGAALKWYAVEVERYGGERAPEEDFTYADCRCGFSCELRSPEDEE